MGETAEWKVPLSDIYVDDELREVVRATLDSGWWSMGPRVAAFEEAFADATGTEHALAVANGTAALHLAFLACGIGPGDEVVLPSLNFVAAANTIRHVGATPVFCDIRGPHDLNLDPADLEAAIGEDTKAVLVLHYGGFPCDMGAVLDIAERHGLVVIEDAAHAVGAVWNGRKCGSIGRVGCFSFFSNKNLPMGEGGIITTNDGELAERLRLLRSHGMTTLTWHRHRGHAHSYDVVLPGFNYRLDEMRAAIGVVQLSRLGQTNKARGRISARYRAELSDVAGLVVPFDVAGIGTSSAHHLAVVVLPTSVSRADVQDAMRAAGVQTSVHYPPIHTFSAYAGEHSRALPRTEDVAGRVLSLPLFAHLSEEGITTVIDSLHDALGARASERAAS